MHRSQNRMILTDPQLKQSNSNEKDLCDLEIAFVELGSAYRSGPPSIHHRVKRRKQLFNYFAMSYTQSTMRTTQLKVRRNGHQTSEMPPLLFISGFITRGDSVQKSLIHYFVTTFLFVSSACAPILSGTHFYASPTPR